MPLDAIPVVVMPVVPPAAAETGNAPILLREIATMARRLAETGEGDAIDLAALPLTVADRIWLRERLGEGEVAVTLNTDGASNLHETACPGVWWVTHRNAFDAVVSEFIEVAFVPEVVKAHPDDVKSGLAHLDSLISDLS